MPCSYKTFTWNVPFYIKKPKPDDWGSCLCAMCLNPELKVEALAKHLNESSYKYRNKIEATEINLLVLKIKEIISKEVIKYTEWQKVPNYNVSAKKGAKVSRKVECLLNMQNFLKILTKESKCLKDHLNRVYTQTKAFEDARTEADLENIVTLQKDWSENPKL